MRTLFMAVGRVFGLLQVYYGITYITSMIPAISMVQQATCDANAKVATHTFAGSAVAITTLSMIATFLLTLAVAWLLLFRTEWLADKLKLPEHDDHPPLSADAILHVGARLLGLFVIIQTVPILVGQLGATIFTIQQVASLRDSMDTDMMERIFLGGIGDDLVAPGIKLILGLVLLLKTNSKQKSY